MTGTLPKIEVTGSQGEEVNSQGDPSDIVGDAPQGVRPQNEGSNLIPHEDEEVMSTPKPRLDPADIGKTNGLAQSDGDTSPQSQTTLDPLSHHILRRMHTENTIPQKFRTGMTDTGSSEGANGNATSPLESTLRKSTDKSRTEEASGTKEKKKGVSFLSRIIGGKKKDAAFDSPDNESETGERRTEGMDAPVFSQPITSNGFTPHHPPPPKYIRVRTHNKKVPDFNRVFLAQELRRTGTSKEGESSRNVIGSDVNRPASKAGAIWALEFSIDGKFLAAGGQDRVVRAWAVISTSEEREMHEHEEDATSVNSTGQPMRLNAPVFKTKPIREYEGHTSDILDLSWSKNNFLLSSSMDKTVRLWHVSREECLCCFKHSDFVTSISFHPRDDRFFLAGSLDSKLRLWSIPDKSVAYWNHLPDLITAVAFTPDGKTSIAGCLNGLCLFYETEGLKYNTQIHVRSAHGRNAKGSKITGIQTVHYPPKDINAEVKILVTSNDSRVRLYNLRDKSLETKFRGNENTYSQIHASFSDDARHVICGSEDRKAYIWSTGPAEGEKKDKRPVEMFAAHNAIVTTTAMAPLRTRQLLSRSGDPIYDLCNPPPVTLISRAESRGSSRPPTVSDQRPQELNVSSAATTLVDSRAKTITPAEESPSYIARSAHPDGNIIVSADYMGTIKVFRQDCAYSRRRNETWDTASTFSKKIGSGFLHRNTGTRARRASTSSHQQSDRILSWRNGISSNASLDNVFRNGGDRTRSASPRKLAFNRPQAVGSTPLAYQNDPSVSTSSPPGSLHENTTVSNTQLRKTQPPSTSQPRHPELETDPDSDPMLLQQGGQSLAFYNVSNWNKAGSSTPAVTTTTTNDTARHSDHRDSVISATSAVSALSSEVEDERQRKTAEVASEEDISEEGEQTLRCKSCGSKSFKATKNKAGDDGWGVGLGLGLVAPRLICMKYVHLHHVYGKTMACNGHKYSSPYFVRLMFENWMRNSCLKRVNERTNDRYVYVKQERQNAHPVFRGFVGAEDYGGSVKRHLDYFLLVSPS
ncbi:MAG: hypothetical protein M1816_004876 [Peltula sp. TS41687]|nr:MAG: hypothetical protein M1816_004876 [Peltula sp. TS41687]